MHQPFFVVFFSVKKFFLDFMPFIPGFFFSKPLTSCPLSTGFFQSHWLVASFNQLFSKPRSYKRWHFYLPSVQGVDRFNEKENSQLRIV